MADGDKLLHQHEDGRAIGLRSIGSRAVDPLTQHDIEQGSLHLVAKGWHVRDGLRNNVFWIRDHHRLVLDREVVEIVTEYSHPQVTCVVLLPRIITEFHVRGVDAFVGSLSTPAIGVRQGQARGSPIDYEVATVNEVSA